MCLSLCGYAHIGTCSLRGQIVWILSRDGVTGQVRPTHLGHGTSSLY